MIGVALVGTGGVFELHEKAISRIKDVEISAVVSREKARAESIAARIGGNCRGFGSLTEALPCCDAVTLCTPPAAHRSDTVEALKAGKAVLVEKPIAQTMADAIDMVETAEKTGGILMTGFNNCFRGGFKFLHDFIQDGSLGTMNSFFIHRQSGSMVKEGVSNWRNSNTAVCGHSIESLSHDISVLRYCAGDVKAVKAYTLNTLPYAPSYDNTAVVAMQLASGAVASLYSDWNSPLGYNWRGASGSKGAIMLSGQGNWEIKEARIRTTDMEHDEIRILNDNLDVTCYVREYEEFISAIQSGKTPSQSGRDGLKTLAVSLAILESQATGKEIAV
ncbi:oxidoreductase [Spirochaetia bacterium]|nr:oxidoreductase [Spirochaetia bacterium]